MTACNVSAYAFCNSSLSFEDRAADLVNRLTLEEKIAQINTYSFVKNNPGITPGISRLGVCEYNYHTEGLHGVRDSYVGGFHNSTLFPQVTAMAATGNLTLVQEMGRVMALEFRAVNNVMAKPAMWSQEEGGGLSVYGPTINLIRDPRWGRNQESVSEDPWLAGHYGAAFINGVQGQNSVTKYLATAATCKHLAAYSMETNRHDSNAEVSALDLAESYLPAFQTCIQAGSAQVMCSYNKINDIPACTDSDIQIDVVRKAWNFNGSIVSDCDAIADITNSQKTMDGPTATAAGIVGGCDQDCGSWYAKYGMDAVKQGKVTEDQIDAALRRTLLLRFKLGEMGESDDQVSWRSVPPSVVGALDHAALAAQAAEEAITLLKNEESTLPLDVQSIRSVALVGPLANSSSVMEGSKQDYNAKHISSVLEGLQNYLLKSPHKATVSFAPGLQSVTDRNTKGFDAAKQVAKVADVTVVVLGIDGSVEAEAKDRLNGLIGLPGAQEDLLKAVVDAVGDKRKVIVVFVHGGPLSSDYIAREMPTLLDAFEGGQSGGDAIARALFGAVNPSGILPYSLYAENFTSAVPFETFQMRPNETYPGRTYRFSTFPVLFPFGHGLSYTTFKLNWDEERLDAYDTSSIHFPGVVHKVKVTNTGKVAGAKVVQAFVSHKYDAAVADAAPAPPIKSLYGQAKVFLRPGESTTVEFTTATSSGAAPFAAVGFSHTKLKADKNLKVSQMEKWVLPGRSTLTIGASEELSRTIEITGEPYRVL
eukprot:CAMPEP_0175124486 /NCGR_PEP_ID=MMETSP0087-20121206/2805_1 /TAXON_ID=136419 /ORGANISM="Unknown Unknown, Strain D1" /LENGTH=761 /DNA_ID=CAMNT_0016406253 /DNA_START=74 /DNA_END=2360 /DNA_ORIENTATION=-